MVEVAGVEPASRLPSNRHVYKFSQFLLKLLILTSNSLFQLFASEYSANYSLLTGKPFLFLQMDDPLSSLSASRSKR